MLWMTEKYPHHMTVHYIVCCGSYAGSCAPSNGKLIVKSLLVGPGVACWIRVLQFIP